MYYDRRGNVRRGQSHKYKWLARASHHEPSVPVRVIRHGKTDEFGSVHGLAAFSTANAGRLVIAKVEDCTLLALSGHRTGEFYVRRHARDV